MEAPPIKDLTFFDDIVTPEAVFPDPKARALFEAMPPETTEKGDERLYSFMLASRSSIKTKRYFRFQQPGMKTKRSLYFISVTVAPAGAFPLGGMGFAVSGGSLDSSVISTPDGIYDFRIMIGSLLPKTIKEPKFDFDATKEQLSLRYSQKLNNSLEGK
ncbi:MAG: hypothetical protein LBG78_08775 [Azoarcus sp.]|nr:hypothetical protein [Azoarcus sp.]